MKIFNLRKFDKKNIRWLVIVVTILFSSISVMIFALKNTSSPLPLSQQSASNLTGASSVNSIVKSDLTVGGIPDYMSDSDSNGVLDHNENELWMVPGQSQENTYSVNYNLVAGIGSGERSDGMYTYGGKNVWGSAGYRAWAEVTNDSNGNAIVTARDDPQMLGNGDIFAQKIKGDTSELLWQAGGVNLTNFPSSQKTSRPPVVTDGSGGAIVAWEDNRSGSWDIYMQHIDLNGSLLWGSQGKILTEASGNQTNVKIVPRKDGGIVAAWRDDRSGTPAIYAQIVDTNGTPLASDVTICTTTGNKYELNIATDYTNGAIISWIDDRVNLDQIYTRRIDGSGTALWTNDGVLVNQFSAIELNSSSDTAGNSYLAWRDSRKDISNDTDIYAQKIDINGNIKWTADGVVVCNEGLTQELPKVSQDNSGGMYITWEDWRPTISGENLFAQRINSSGQPAWTVNGIVISNISQFDYNARIIDFFGNKSVIIWQDSIYSNSSSDISAQIIAESGKVGPRIDLARNQLNESQPRIARDNNNGVFVVWDTQDGSHIERLNLIESPDRMWGEDGKAMMANATVDESYVDVAVDNEINEGNYYAWQQEDNGYASIFVKRVPEKTGPSWTIKVCSTTSSYACAQPSLDMSPSGQHLVVAWHDSRFGTNNKIFVQKIEPQTGNILWPVNGVQAAPGAAGIANQRFANIVVNDGGYSNIVWGQSQLWAQKLDPGGNRLWTDDGKLVNNTVINKNSRVIDTDFANKSYIIWYDNRNGNNDVFGQRLDINGNREWDVDGKLMISNSANQRYTDAQVAQNNLYVVWNDLRNISPNGSIYAQKFDLDGNELWTSGGMRIVDLDQQSNPSISADYIGNVYISWFDWRTSVWPSHSYAKPFAIKMDSSGKNIWRINGMPAVLTDASREPPKIATNSNGVSYLAWRQWSSNGTWDIYTQRLYATGGYGATPQSIVDTIPVNTTYLDASSGGVFDPATRNVTWSGILPGAGDLWVKVSVPNNWLELLPPEQRYADLDGYSYGWLENSVTMAGLTATDRSKIKRYKSIFYGDVFAPGTRGYSYYSSFSPGIATFSGQWMYNNYVFRPDSSVKWDKTKTTLNLRFNEYWQIATPVPPLPMNYSIPGSLQPGIYKYTGSSPLELGGQIFGAGTILVQNQDVIITNNLLFNDDNSALGVIVSGGNVTIEGDVSEVNIFMAALPDPSTGAGGNFFAADAPTSVRLYMQGVIVAQNVDLEQRPEGSDIEPGIIAVYDGRASVLHLPMFGDVKSGSWAEPPP